MENSGLNIVLVDDEASVLDWLIKKVDWESYNCKIVGLFTDAKKALADMKGLSVDVLFTDICMPEVSGLELIKCTKELFPDICIVVISAHDKFSYVKEALHYGILNYCLKPIDLEEVLECVKQAWNIREERRQQYYSQGKIVFRNNVLLKLLNWERDDSWLEEQCDLAGIHLNKKCWQVAYMDIRHLEVSSRIILLNHFRKKEAEGYYCFLDADMKIVFLFFTDTVPMEKQRIKEIIKHDREKDVCVCVGRVVESYWQIAASYRECRDFGNAGFLFPKWIIWVGEYPYEKYLDVLPGKEMQEWIKSLKMYDTGSMIQILRTVVGRYMTEEEKKEELTCLVVFLIKNILVSFEQGKLTVLEKEFENILDLSLTAETMLRRVESLIERFLTKNKDIGYSYHPYVKYMLQEISTRFGDSELSLQEIAKRRDISAAYLGKLFKEQMGVFFNEYLLKTRLEVASAMLRNSRLNMGAIAAEVGFSNQSYFNKMFRRNYGISPAEYRRRAYEEQEE